MVSADGGLIGVEDARRLLQSIATSHAVGLRDRRRSHTEQTVRFSRLTMELVHAIIPQFAWPIINCVRKTVNSQSGLAFSLSHRKRTDPGRDSLRSFGGRNRVRRAAYIARVGQLPMNSGVPPGLASVTGEPKLFQRPVT